MTKKITWFTALALGMVPLSQAETAAPPLMQADSAAATPVASQQLGFKQLAPAPGSFALKGTSPVGYIQFGVRHDEVVTQASLQLEFTPSPTLTPVESHLKVYLNEVLMGVVAITKEQVGQPTRATLPLDPRYITDFNRVRLEFVGHYKSLCQDPSSSSLWLNISQASSLNLQMQKLPLKNDLAAFPIPFFDARDNRPLTLPMVFNQQPDLGQQQAAAILASWFGARAQWRGQSFPALFNQLPDSHAVVFATNAQRPDFLRDYPLVNGPTVEVISHPQNPYVKLLLVQGRDDNDLITAVKGIAQGNILFRGQNVSVDRVEQLAPRQPYDAPNWIRT
ncbi:cellulose biosynthesis cyclic di-GMP-binding regulatory protein BcsB, partial [Candidatus Symbiopectobacterium sp. NZEC135]|uniref:cellulose biosynthesis cyclic di-GMP-binding regulatory protein BcsB n=1 Tax=Candidatus Symbiopectobacterium sp. NZEC135 TaxID=2820471 RepID=UPI0022280542